MSRAGCQAVGILSEFPASNAFSVQFDSNHYVATLKKGGKVIGTSKVAVSKDGKVTTVDPTATTASGAKEHDLQVYDKK